MKKRDFMGYQWGFITFYNQEFRPWRPDYRSLMWAWRKTRQLNPAMNLQCSWDERRDWIRLVNVYKKRWKDPPCCYPWVIPRSKSPFSSSQTVSHYQRVFDKDCGARNDSDQITKMQKVLSSKGSQICFVIWWRQITTAKEIIRRFRPWKQGVSHNWGTSGSSKHLLQRSTIQLPWLSPKVTTSCHLLIFAHLMVHFRPKIRFFFFFSVNYGNTPKSNGLSSSSLWNTCFEVYGICIYIYIITYIYI